MTGGKKEVAYLQIWDLKRRILSYLEAVRPDSAHNPSYKKGDAILTSFGGTKDCHNKSAALP